MEKIVSSATSSTFRGAYLQHATDDKSTYKCFLNFENQLKVTMTAINTSRIQKRNYHYVS
jgi:hypothetical protein